MPNRNETQTGEMTEVMRTALAHGAGEAMAAQFPAFDPKEPRNYALVPIGFTVEHIAGRPDVPEEMNLSPAFYEAESLSAYVNRFFTDTAVAFTDWKRAEINVAFDYLAASDGGKAGAKCWEDHRAKFHARATEAWEKWHGLHDRLIAQRDFIRFLEERAHEIVEPDAASVMDAAMNFEAVKKVDFKSSQRLHNGYRQFVYVEDDQAKGSVDLPEMLTINVPVFEGQEPIRIRVRLRFRIDDGKLMLGLAIDNVDEIRKAAFERCLDTFRTGLDGSAKGLPIYKGGR